MKPLKINDVEYQILDDITELYEFRLPYLKEYILRSFENDDFSSIIKFHEEAKKLINDGNHYDLVVKIDNLRLSFEKKEPKLENIYFAFSMICLSPGEDQLNVDINYHADKINKLLSGGIKGGLMAKSVLSFMKASPFEFRNFEALMQMMNALLNKE